MLCSPCVTNAYVKSRRWLPVAAFALLMTALSGCGGGMGYSSSAMAPAAPAAPAGCTPSTCGSMVVTMTDAAGDFLSYQVSLVSLQLQKADGTKVETLPSTPPVDFAQLINFSEILNARQLPP